MDVTMNKAKLEQSVGSGWAQERWEAKIERGEEKGDSPHWLHALPQGQITFMPFKWVSRHQREKQGSSRCWSAGKSRG